MPTLAYIFVIGPCFNFIINLTLVRYFNLITDQLLSVENYKYHRSLENVYFILIRMKLKILLPAHCVNSKMLRYFVTPEDKICCALPINVRNEHIDRLSRGN